MAPVKKCSKNLLAYSSIISSQWQRLWNDDRALCALLLLALCCVSAASAGGMVKFHIPAVEDAKVGDTVTVTLYNDNNLAPPRATSPSTSTGTWRS